MAKWVCDVCGYIYDPEQGGALYDTGIYNIAAVLDFVKSPVVSISNDVKMEHDVDVHDAITLTFENGVKAKFKTLQTIQKSPILLDFDAS